MKNTTADEARQALLRLLRENQNGAMLGKVESVEEEKVNCTVSLVNTPEIVLENVRLRATDDERDEGFVIFPRVGSYVLIGKTLFFDAYYVAMFSEIENIIINGGKLGGMVKVNDLVKKMNDIEQALNQLKQLITSWTPAPGDGGGALKLLISTWASQSLTPTQVKDLENPSVKQ